MNNTNKKKQGKINLKKSFLLIFGGGLITADFFNKNLIFLVYLVSIFFFYTSHRYTCIRKQANIEKLRIDLVDAKQESLTISSELTKANRKQEIERRLKENNIELEIPSDPVYIIK